MVSVLLSAGRCSSQSSRFLSSSYLSAAQRGFTLIELLVVAFLLAIMSTILWGSFNGLLRSREMIDVKRKALRTGYSLMRRTCSELVSALPGRLIKFNDLSGARMKQGAGMERIDAFLGMNARIGDADADSLSFVSTTGAQAIIGKPGNRGPVQIRYFVVKTPQTDDRLILGEGETRLTLVREELPADLDLEEELHNLKQIERKIEGKIIRFPITSDLASLNFRYYDADRWVDEWKSRGKSLPRGVEISFRVYQKGGGTLHFKTAVTLPPH